MPFHGLRAHFFLALNNIPLSGCTQFICPFTSCSIPWLLPSLGNYEQSYCKYLRVGFCVDVSFQFFGGKYRGSQMLDNMMRVCFVRSYQSLPKYWQHCAFLPAMSGSHRCSASSQPFLLSEFGGLGRSNRFVMVVHC